MSCGNVLFCVEFNDYFEIMKKIRGGKKLLMMRDGFPQKNIHNISGN